MEVNCQVKEVFHKFDLTRPFWKRVFLDFAEGQWKSRLTITYHLNLRDIPLRRQFLWHLKSISSETSDLKWSVLRCALPYSLEILTYQNQRILLNNRSELLCKFCHANKFLFKIDRYMDCSLNFAKKAKVGIIRSVKSFTK